MRNLLADAHGRARQTSPATERPAKLGQRKNGSQNDRLQGKGRGEQS